MRGGDPCGRPGRVIERVDRVQQGTAGTHKGPHSTLNHPCPYAKHDVVHK